MEGTRDYYEVIGVSPSATESEIRSSVRALLMQWHPDVCKAPNAHERTVEILEAKEVLLDPSMRAQYDRSRAGFATEPSDYHNSNDAWTEMRASARYRAQSQATGSLEELLENMVTIAVVAASSGVTYAWSGSRHYTGPSGCQLFWVGIAGWACVICLIVPGVSIITFFCFYWAFFPGPYNRFIGIGNVIKGMLLSLLGIIPLLGVLIAAISSM